MFATRLLVGVAFLVVSGAMEFLRMREGVSASTVAGLFLGQVSLALIGLGFFVWAICHLFWTDVKRIIEWVSKD